MCVCCGGGGVPPVLRTAGPTPGFSLTLPFLSLSTLRSEPLTSHHQPQHPTKAVKQLAPLSLLYSNVTMYIVTPTSPWLPHPTSCTSLKTFSLLLPSALCFRPSQATRSLSFRTAATPASRQGPSSPELLSLSHQGPSQGCPSPASPDLLCFWAHLKAGCSILQLMHIESCKIDFKMRMV